jgi:hypothetical protein
VNLLLWVYVRVQWCGGVERLTATFGQLARAELLLVQGTLMEGMHNGMFRCTRADASLQFAGGCLHMHKLHMPLCDYLQASLASYLSALLD